MSAEQQKKEFDFASRLLNWVYKQHAQSQDVVWPMMVFESLRKMEKHGPSITYWSILSITIGSCLCSAGISIWIWKSYSFLLGLLFLILSERCAYGWIRYRCPMVPLEWWMPGPLVWGQVYYVGLVISGQRVLRFGMWNFFKWHMDCIQHQLSDETKECMMKMTIFEDDPRNFFNVEVPKDIKNVILKFTFDECITAVASERTAVREILVDMVSMVDGLDLPREDAVPAMIHIMDFAFPPTMSRLETIFADEVTPFYRDVDGYMHQMVGKVRVFNGLTYRELDISITFGPVSSNRLACNFLDVSSFRGYELKYWDAGEEHD